MPDDEVGGEVDRLENEVETAVTDLAAPPSISAALVTTDTTTLDVDRALQLLRLWNLTTQARYELLTGADTAAQETIDLAQNGLAAMLATTDADAAMLAMAATRLDLAAASLPADRETALNDLTAAGNELDRALTALLGEPAPAAEDGETAATATPATTPTPDVEDGTGTPAATPAATVTATPVSETPTPTATPTP